ncbi:MAG: aldo/keto reductase family oxidoreductase [Croceivirga sp.]
MSKSINYAPIIAGTMTWGSWGKQLSKSEMIDLMMFCVSEGLTTFDHADIYGAYENEKAFGAAFSESGIERDGVQLITKCGIQMTQGRENKVKHYQYDADYIVWSAEQSLKKLRTDYVDLFLLHRPSPLMHPDEVARAIEKLKASGKIRQFGVSNFSPSQIMLLEKSVGVEGNQVECSLTHTAPMEDGTFDDCLASDRMAMTWSPLGNYFRQNNQQNERISAVLDELKDKYDADDSQLLLAFLFKHPVQVYPVVGTTNKERLSNSIKAANIDLDLQDWFVLLEASKGNEVA